MAGITYFGTVGSTGTSTGPHKHVYVKDIASGQYIDPATIRSVLSGFRIGKDRIPALTKDSAGKYIINPQSGITLTSGFGHRSAPTAGASTYHRGEDWALPEGTPIYFEGAGTYKPLANQGGYGNLATFTTADNKYEIGVGHMQSLGKPGSITGASQPTQQSSSDSAAFSLLTELLRPTKEDKPSLTEQLLSSAISSKLRQREPQSFLSSYAGLLSQAANPYQDVLLDSSLLGMS
jgi:hypothetical protein